MTISAAAAQRRSSPYDHLCDLGLALSATRFGEGPDNRIPAGELDEALGLVLAMWSGNEVSRSGPAAGGYPGLGS